MGFKKICIILGMITTVIIVTGILDSRKVTPRSHMIIPFKYIKNDKYSWYQREDSEPMMRNRIENAAGMLNSQPYLLVIPR